MAKYAKGTQADLDAAKNDATLLPFDTVFMYDGEEVIRQVHALDDPYTIFMIPLNVEATGRYCGWYPLSMLLPANKDKKPKQKKWQNGTQEQLDIAKEDARLIPKKTYFMSKWGCTEGTKVFRVDNPVNDSSTTMMSNINLDCDFHSAEDLEPINEN